MKYTFGSPYDYLIDFKMSADADPDGQACVDFSGACPIARTLLRINPVDRVSVGYNDASMWGRYDNGGDWCETFPDWLQAISDAITANKFFTNAEVYHLAVDAVWSVITTIPPPHTILR